MNSILVATDLSKENKILLDRALEIASITKSELHILHVLYVVRFEPNDDIFLIEEKKCRKWIEKYIEKSGHKNDVPFKIHIADGGHIHEQIDLYMNHLQPHMALIGQSSQNRDAPDFILSTVENLIMQSSYPVLIIPNIKPDNDYNSISIYAEKPDAVVQLLNILVPYTGNKIETIHVFLDEYFRMQRFIFRLHRKYLERAYMNVKKSIETLLERYNLRQKIKIEQHCEQHLQNLFTHINKEQMRAIAIEIPNYALNDDELDSSLRKVLSNSKCELLILGDTK